MSRAKLSKKLSSLESFSGPRVELEQYVTPPALAADMIWTARMNGDLEGKVADLGAGTGILGLGAAVLGAGAVLVEKDPEALDIARRNAEKLNVEPEFVEGDVEELDREFDTVVMNPPFSVHSDELDSFLRKSAEADSVYTLANAGSDRVPEFYRDHGFEVASVEEYTLALPATYGFHTQEERETEVRLVVARQG